MTEWEQWTLKPVLEAVKCWAFFCLGHGFLCHILNAFPLVAWAVLHPHISSTSVHIIRKRALKSFPPSSNILEKFLFSKVVERQVGSVWCLKATCSSLMTDQLQAVLAMK